MLSELEIAENTRALFDAMRYIDAGKIGTMVVYATAPICVLIDRVKALNKVPRSVRFTHDKNIPKVAIDSLEILPFHTEFSIGWQKFIFRDNKKLLVTVGKSERFPNGYRLHLHLKGKKAMRNA